MGKAYKVVFLGDSSVGKTALIVQLIYNKFQNVAPTVGIDFLSMDYDVNDRKVRLQIWDTAGQERFRSIAANYTRNTFLAIIVFSVTNWTSLKNVEAWIRDYVLIHNDNKETHILIVGNKEDETEKAFPDYKEKAKAIADKLGVRLVMTSAVTNETIRDMENAIKEYIEEDIKKNGGEEEAKDELNVLTATSSRRGCC